MQLILSLFPGIDLLGKGFEQAGFCVVRAPDIIHGGDIRNFHAPAGKFSGIIGGPPCQDFSRARRTPPTGYGREMLNEYIRLVQEARPAWWLMENVPEVPDVVIEGYQRVRFALAAHEFGLPQRRRRHFQFGHFLGLVPLIPRSTPANTPLEPCCMASEGSRQDRRGWTEFVALQGLPGDFELPGMTLKGKYRAVGNGVPVPMAYAIARGIQTAIDPEFRRLCACGCGRIVTGKEKTAGPACRKRRQRQGQATTL